jgi:hypothetical protein
MNNRTTKVLLALIAAGLWANALMPLVKPTPAHAKIFGDPIVSIAETLESIAGGACRNQKLC